MQIHEHEGNWYFWDETGIRQSVNRIGPFPTREDCEEAHGRYEREVLALSVQELTSAPSKDEVDGFSNLMGVGKPMPAPKGTPGPLARAKSAFRTAVNSGWHEYKRTVEELGGDYKPIKAMSLREASRRRLIPSRRGPSELDKALAAAPTELEYQEQVQRTLATNPAFSELQVGTPPESTQALTKLRLLEGPEI